MATAAILIEKNVPLPESRGGSGQRYPFREMQPGDSFEVKLADSGLRDLGSLSRTLNGCGRAIYGRGAIATRANQDGTAVRVWRLK